MRKSKEPITVKEIERYTPKYDSGLNEEQVALRNEQGAKNVIIDKNGKSYGKIILKNFITFFNVIYIIIAILLITAHAKPTSFFFALIVLANTLIGTIQEIQAKRTIDKLSLLSTPTVTVMRGGNKQEIKVEEIVLDDMMYLTPGREITTDAILVQGEVEVNESQLTGESIAIRKQVGDVLYSGSFIVSGNCYAQVERVGADNAIEKLSAQAKTYKKPKSEILRSLNLLLKVIAVILILTGLTMFLQNWDFKAFIANGWKMTPALKESYNAIITSTSTALIGMIPAGLYLLTSVALAVGVIRLSHSKTLVQDIYCIEMLARVDVLCLDKTGTITDGTMSVVRYIEYQRGSTHNIQEIVGSLNTALQETNSTAKALEAYFGFSKKMLPTEVMAFSSERKYSAVTFGESGTYILGAPEFILKTNLDKYVDDINGFANQGLRVIALAHSPQPLKNGNIQRVPKLLALILIEDQIRKEAYETIAYFKDNGVEVKVISGDNPVTVSEVAKRVGIVNAEEYVSLDGMSDEDVFESANKYTVFGRVKPDQKQILVKALKAAKKTVAMTGDGVNDILALKAADCSIAMASGSDAVRSVAQLVLLDSNFASMPKVVGEGRRVINNIQQTSMLFLVKTLFIIILAILTVSGFIGKYGPEGNGSFPFANPSQLFMIETFAIGIPAFFLALQANYNRVKGNFLMNVLKRALPGAGAVAIEVVVTYILAKKLGLTLEQVKTIVVICATATCLMVLYMACRPFTWKKTTLFITMIVCCIVVTWGSMAGFVIPIFNINLKDYELYHLYTKLADGTYNASGTFLAIILSMGSYIIMTAFSYLIFILETKVFVEPKNKKKKITSN